MIRRYTFLIIVMITAGCSPNIYIVRDVDANHRIMTINQEQVACIGSIPITFGDNVPYGLQQSVNYKTKSPVPLVWINIRVLFQHSIRDFAANVDQVCKDQSVESLLIREISHENDFENDTGSSIFSGRLTASILINCKGHTEKLDTVLEGDGPPMDGGFFGSIARSEAALARSTTYAVYDLLMNAEKVCKANKGVSTLYHLSVFMLSTIKGVSTLFHMS